MEEPNLSVSGKEYTELQTVQIVSEAVSSSSTPSGTVVNKPYRKPRTDLSNLTLEQRQQRARVLCRVSGRERRKRKAAELTAERAEAAKRIEDLERDLNLSKLESELLASKLEGYECDGDELHIKYAELKTENIQLRKQLVNTESVNIQLRNQITNVENKNHLLTTTNTRIKDESVPLNAKVKELTENNFELSINVHKMQSMYDIIEQEKLQLQSNLDDLKGSRPNFERQISELTSVNADVSAENDLLKLKLNDAESQVQSLDNDVETLRGILADLGSTLPRYVS